MIALRTERGRKRREEDGESELGPDVECTEPFDAEKEKSLMERYLKMKPSSRKNDTHSNVCLGKARTTFVRVFKTFFGPIDVELLSTHLSTQRTETWVKRVKKHFNSPILDGDDMGEEQEEFTGFSD